MATRKELSKTDRLAAIAAMEGLRRFDCVTSYTIEGESVQAKWNENGFATAFEQLKTNPYPLGLKKKRERGWLYLLLAQEDKATINAWERQMFKEKYGIDKSHEA